MADHGQLLAGPFPVEGGTKEARFYERALVLKQSGINSELECPYRFPMIGLPHITKPGQGAVEVLPAAQTVRVVDAYQRAGAEALSQRLGLVPTGGGTAVPVKIGEPVAVERPPRQTPIFGFPATAQIEERKLYDVAVKGDDGQWRVVGPHAVYHRASWSTFGVAHATDLHVSRRIDGFRPRLRELGRHEAADKLYNWNDRFRGFIRQANLLHGQGKLDLILATGDIIDYQTENTEADEAAGGNAAFLRDLLLGRAPGQDFQDVEELRVPIFLTTGNHDYRRYPYPLIWELDITGPNQGPYGHFSGFHMLRDDAEALNGGVSKLGEVASTLPVLVERDMKGHRAHLADRTTYMIELGKHRIAMLDAGSDIGIVTTLDEAVHGEIFGRTEDKQMFIDGNPRSQGPDAEGVKLLTDSLAVMPDDGLYMVGLHAPLINPVGNSYPYFLRETVRPENEDRVLDFIRRHDEDSDSEEKARERHPTWFAPPRDHRGVRYVKRGDNADLLDWGTSHNDFLPKLLNRVAGAEGHRPADLVLHGHIHSHNEFRAALENGEVRFYFDFYTENPAAYYPTRFGSGDDVTYVEVVDGAPARGIPSAMPFEAKHKFVVRTPPYAEPLNSAADKRGWWQRHRPLLLQTSCLTPLDNDQASFSGFRVISVADDVIQAIHFVSMDRIQAGGYRLPWEEAVKPQPPRTHRHAPRSRPVEAAEAAGTPFGYLSQATPGVDDVVYRAADGHLTQVWREPNGVLGRGDLTAAAGAGPASSDPFVYIDPNTKHQIVLYRGDDGGVHSLYWTTAEVGHDALSGSVGAPDTAGRPVGYLNPEQGVHHVFYRGDDGNLHCLFWQGADAAKHEELSRFAPGEPKAKGDPIGYSANGVNHLIFRGEDDHIRALYWSTGATGHDDLSGVAGSPAAAGDPHAFFTPHDQAHQVHYRGTDGHIHELWWVGDQRVSHIDLSALAGSPPAVTDPASYYDARTNTKHVYYTNDRGQIVELWWVPGQTNATMAEVSIWALAAPAAGRVHAFAGTHLQHVVYRGTDNHIHEIRW